jgi:hypothetical protein
MSKKYSRLTKTYLITVGNIIKTNLARQGISIIVEESADPYLDETIYFWDKDKESCLFFIRLIGENAISCESTTSRYSGNSVSLGVYPLKEFKFDIFISNYREKIVEKQKQILANIQNDLQYLEYCLL